MLGIGVKQSPNHPLILRVVLLRLGFEKVDATLAQSNGDLDSFVLKHKIFWPWKEVSYDLRTSEGFVRVLYFRAHRFVFPSANSLRQICVLRRHGT